MALRLLFANNKANLCLNKISKPVLKHNSHCGVLVTKYPKTLAFCKGLNSRTKIYENFPSNEALH